MKSKLNRGGLFILALMLAMAFSFTGAMAQDNYEPVSGSADVLSVKKVLDLNGAENVPEHTVTIKTTLSSSDPSGLSVSGSVPDVVMKFDDNLSINSDKAEMVKHIDFSRVSFPKPGKYRFQVNEAITDNPNVHQKTGGASHYNVDVWVKNDAIDPVSGKTKLKIDAYNVYRENSTAKSNYGETGELVFENTYNYYRFYVEKKVNGNVGDKTKMFKIWVNIKGLVEGDTVVIRGVSGTPKAGAGTGSVISYQDVTATPLTLTASSGAASCTLGLKDTDRVLIEGLCSGSSFRVEEESTYVTDYNISYNPSTANSGSSTNSTYTLKIPANNGQVVTITNTRERSIPTGIFINNWPYILAVFIAVVGCIFFVRRRKARYDYEGDL